MTSAPPVIAVLGASGLIGQAVTLHLLGEGFAVVPVARAFTAAQMAAYGEGARESAVVGLDGQGLAGLIAGCGADIVVNCIGVLQDSARRGSAADAHVGFVGRLTAALAAGDRERLLVHLSIPGDDEDDATAFSATKRAAERIVAASGVPHVILRPGFVVAPAAYGGSALIRALATLPFDLPVREASRPFAATDVADVGRTLAVIARRWREGERNWQARWAVMERQAGTVGAVIAAFRRHLGGPARRVRLPGWLMRLGAAAGDGAAKLGWSPPIRGTALAETRRGVAGDPAEWIAATGIEPRSLPQALRGLPSTVQERWFAKLYLLKALVVGGLALFWIVSGLVALTVAFVAATAILTAHGFPLRLAQAVTAATSLADIAVGAAIAWRATCRAGLVAGIGLSLAYMAGAAIVTPVLWLDPLGALVKTGPAILLMLVALAMLDER